MKLNKVKIELKRKKTYIEQKIERLRKLGSQKQKETHKYKLNGHYWYILALFPIMPI